ncbi:MAG: UDP-N-acetylmuramoyl-L-alanyl-D-glutamate--2,6-diaminopimelate ligase [Chlamydiae bacterium]|nr:UDP-N-acetylmuramoyl-L-alanyl-D-glutamate--2,6-diaminopimelate ligase [Chlamydiota bacterium]
MNLKQLLKNFPEILVKGNRDIEVANLCNNSKLATPGSLFIARKGKKFDGNLFIPEAISGGSVAVLTDVYDPFLDVVQLIYPQVEEIEPRLAAEFYGHPSKQLSLIGITGTNGKTTTSFLIYHLLNHSGLKTGVIGTIEWIIGDRHFPSTMATYDVVTNQRLLSEMVEAGCKAVTMEVSSHGLDQGRIREIAFTTAVFTNLTLDHLDYHITLDHYLRSKLKLFEMIDEKATAVINADDPHSSRFSEVTKAKKLKFGIESETADMKGKILRMTEKFVQFEVSFEGKKTVFQVGLIGKFNVYNILGAIAVGLSFGISLDASSEILSKFKGVEGRLQKIENGLGLNIFVDYAHTEDGLKNVLSTLHPLRKSSAKIITVFGCGGDRDKSKRKEMGKVAAQLSDLSYVTTDNPRGEDPQEIVKEILEGFAFHKDKVVVELDRKAAIEKAIAHAKRDDFILIAGKGHEKKQVFSHKTVDFDDVEIAMKAARVK